MYRDGNFQSLRWNMLEASHKAHWEKLSSVYGLEEPEKLLKSEAQKKDLFEKGRYPLHCIRNY